MKDQANMLSVQQMTNLVETYTLKELLESNFPAKDILRKHPGASIKLFLDNEYGLTDLRYAGFSAMSMRQCGVKLERLIGLGYSLKEIKAIAPGWLWGGAQSFKLEEFVAEECSIDELLSAGFTINQLKLHFTCEQMRNSQVTVAKVLNNFNREELLLGGYTSDEIDQANREIQERNEQLLKGIVAVGVAVALALKAAEEGKKRHEEENEVNRKRNNPTPTYERIRNSNGNW